MDQVIQLLLAQVAATNQLLAQVAALIASGGLVTQAQKDAISAATVSLKSATDAVVLPPA